MAVILFPLITLHFWKHGLNGKKGFFEETKYRGRMTIYSINTMKNNLLLFLFIFLLIPGFLSAAELHTLDIEFAFSDPGDPESQLLGYILYKEGDPVCETNDTDASMITCELLTEDGTFNFNLTAFYADGTESPPSPSFPFTISSMPDTIIEATVDHFTFSVVNNQVNSVPFQITVEARDSDDTLVPEFTGTADLSDTTGTITPITSGNFSNGTWSGNATINAEATDVEIYIQGGVSTGASNLFDVNAPSQVLDRIEITPAVTKLSTDNQQQFTAQGYDTANNPMTVVYTWAVINGGGTIDQNGLFTAGSTPGNYKNTVEVSAEGITTTATVRLHR
jgi:hypothetical protein